MNLITVDKVYSGEKLKVPMVIDVSTATWVNNKIRPTKGTMYEKGYYYWTVVLDNGKKKHIRVHRQVWYAVNGAIPTDKQVDHIDNDKSHNYINNLQLLSPKDNTNKPETKEKARLAILGKGGILDKDKACDIYYLAHRTNLTQKKIGELFGVKQETVFNIKAQNSWKWATDAINLSSYELKTKLDI